MNATAETPVVPDVLGTQQTMTAESAAVSAFVQANRIPVTDDASLARAVEIRKQIGERLKGIAAKLEQPKSWANGLHKWFCGLERTAMAPLEELDVYERHQIYLYGEGAKARRREAERLAAEEQRRVNEAAALTQAAALEDDGDHDMAAAIVEEVIARPAPVVVLPDTYKAVVKTRKTYRWRYVNNDAAAARKVIPAEYLAVDEKKIDNYAKAMKGTGAIAGVEFYETDDPIR